MKKPFIDRNNPAMSFISSAGMENPEQNAQATAEAPELIIKKSGPPAGFKRNPEYIETKSRRLQLMLQPSLYIKVKVAATANGVSVNEYIHKVLEAAVRE